MTMTADVVVVGAGAAGLAAAVSAREAGLDTLLLEKERHPGGTSARAVGSICVCVRSAGDTDEEFLADIDGFVDPQLRSTMPADLLALIAEHSEATRDWLGGHGVRFAGPYQEPPHRRARLFAAVPDGGGIVAPLADAYAATGGDLVVEARLVGLQQTDGRVDGVVAEIDGREIVIRARWGVVLATGDFAGNADWRRRYLPRAAAASPAVNPASRGEGIRLGALAGGAVRALGVAFAPQLRFRAAPPQPSGRPDSSPAAVAVEVARELAPDADIAIAGREAMRRARLAPARHLFQHGARMVRADGQLIEPGDHDALTTPEATFAYVVLDGRWLPGGPLGDQPVSSAPAIGFATLADYVAARPDLVSVADSVADLSALIDVDLSAVGGELDQLRPPLVALGPAGPLVTVTEGSLAVDREQRVLDDRGQPVPGLYAAGATGQGGLLLLGHGLHLGWAVISGRLVGTRVAGRARDADRA